MKQAPLSVRQWLEQYQAGAFSGRDLDTASKAGWCDWHCHFDALAGRLKLLAPVITGIKEPLILDGYSVSFANLRCPGRKVLYDRVWFQALDAVREGPSFYLNRGSPDEPEKWALYTKRFGFQSPEFCCARVREMTGYIEKVAWELDQGVRPSFLDEQAAAVRYSLRHNALYPSGAVCRTGEHSYSFLDRNIRRKDIYAASALEDVPPALRASGAMKIDRLYVFCPDDMELQRTSKKSQKKRRDHER